MSSRSSNASRYGSLAEQRAADRYGLKREGVHGYAVDAVAPDGTPWEIKAAMATRADGSEGRFRVFEDAHDQLAAKGGRYAFVADRPHGQGIMVLRMTSMPATNLPLSRWYGAGGHRDSRQTKLAIADVFG